MQNILLRVSIFIIAFGIGISAGWIANALMDSIPPLNPMLVDQTRDFLGYERPRFSPAGRGCGNGYTQTYKTNDGESVAEGVRSYYNSPGKARAEFQAMIHGATTVFEQMRYKNESGELGERAIIMSHPVDAGGYEPILILHYDGGNSYRFIEAPSLSLALEFEDFLITTKNK